MREHRVKAAPLARAAKLNESAVRDILRGRSRNPGIVTLSKIASVLKLRPSVLFEAGQSWPVIGHVGPDGVISKIDDGDTELEAVENPFFAFREEEYAAVQDRSGSVAPLAYEGDYLIFSARHEGVSERDIGRPCICRTEDGRDLVRILRLGDKPNCYHLTPLNMYAAPEMNVPLQHAARVILSLPADFAPKLPKPTHSAPATLQEDQTPYRGSNR